MYSKLTEISNTKTALQPQGVKSPILVGLTTYEVQAAKPCIKLQCGCYDCIRMKNSTLL